MSVWKKLYMYFYIYIYESRSLQASILQMDCWISETSEKSISNRTDLCFVTLHCRLPAKPISQNANWPKKNEKWHMKMGWDGDKIDIVSSSRTKEMFCEAFGRKISTLPSRTIPFFLMLHRYSISISIDRYAVIKWNHSIFESKWLRL